MLSEVSAEGHESTAFRMLVESSDDGSLSLEPVRACWTYAKGSRLGNICWCHNLLQSNRARLYREIVRSISRVAQEAFEPKNVDGLARVAFERVVVPADGRCGWRSFLAASDIESYKRVTRT